MINSAGKQYLTVATLTDCAVHQPWGWLISKHSYGCARTSPSLCLPCWGVNQGWSTVPARMYKVSTRLFCVPWITPRKQKDPSLQSDAGRRVSLCKEESLRRQEGGSLSTLIRHVSRVPLETVWTVSTRHWTQQHQARTAPRNDMPSKQGQTQQLPSHAHSDLWSWAGALYTWWQMSGRYKAGSFLCFFR